MTTRPVRAIRAAVLGGAILGVALVAAVAGAASAHIEPDPAAAQAGTTTTIQFKIEHGCDGSPTTMVEIKAPDSVTNVAAVDKPGWTGAVTGGVVSYAGGRLGPDTPDTFGVTVKSPTAAGKLAFPTVQTCEKGSLDWIEPMRAGGAEPEHPAPVVEVTAGAPTSSEAAASHDQTAASTSVTDTGLDTVAGEGGKKSSDNKSLLIGGVVAAAVVIAGGLALTRLRQRDNQR